MTPRSLVRQARIPLLLAFTALAAKLWLSATTLGTSDVRAFQFFLKAYLGSGAARLYEADPNLNHPPFVLRILVGLRWLVHVTGLPWPFCLRLPGILADLGMFLVLLRIVAARYASGLATESEGRSIRTTLALVAVAPVSVLMSGFQGNTDPVMIFFVLLSVYLAEKRSPTWLAGAAMGIAVSVKIVPLVFWPAVFLWLPAFRRRIEYFGAAALVIVAGASPELFQAPGLLARKVLGYRGSYGLWGLSRLASSVPAIDEAFRSSGRWILVALLVALSWWMNHRSRKPSLYRQLGVLTSAFLAFAPAFGPQYLVWLVPFLVGVPLGVLLAFLTTTGFFFVLLYTFWCQGVEYQDGVTNWFSAEFWRLGTPWYYANADQLGPWRGEIVLVEIASWISVVVLFGFQVRSAAAERRAAVLPAQAD